MNERRKILEKIAEVINENAVAINAEVVTNYVFVSLTEGDTVERYCGDAIVINVVRSIPLVYRKGKKLVIPAKDIQIGIVKEKAEADFARRIKQGKMTFYDVARIFRNASNDTIDLMKLR